MSSVEVVNAVAREQARIREALVHLDTHEVIRGASIEEGYVDTYVSRAEVLKLLHGNEGSRAVPTSYAVQ